MSHIALITGSTSGIGLGLAECFARNGISVVIHGLEPEGLDIATQLAERYRVATHYSDHDLSTSEGTRDLIAEAEEKIGEIDILVNNAGIQHVSPVEDFGEEKWNAILGVNLSAPFRLSRAVWAGMKARNYGRIINIASVHGLRASEFKAAYVAAKHGLVGLTKALALEGAPVGITVNALCPAYVMTPLVEKQIDHQAVAHGLSREEVVSRVMLRKQPLKEFIPISTIAEMALFLVSTEGAPVTGTAIPLDGGWCAQ